MLLSKERAQILAAGQKSCQDILYQLVLGCLEAQTIPIGDNKLVNVRIRLTRRFAAHESEHEMGASDMKLSAFLVVSSIFVASPVYAQSFSELVGEWVAREGPNRGSRLSIKSNNDVHDSVFGSGRMASTISYAANYVIVYEGDSRCYFYISLSGPSNNREMELEVKSPGTASNPRCLQGYFRRRSDSGADLGRSNTEATTSERSNPSAQRQSFFGEPFIRNRNSATSDRVWYILANKYNADSLCRSHGFAGASSWGQRRARATDQTYDYSDNIIHFGANRDGFVDRSIMINVYCQ